MPIVSLNLERWGIKSIATLAGQPIWATREEGGRWTYLSAMSHIQMDETSVLCKCFAPRNFVRLLPLVDFLRRLTGENESRSPGLRACFMFDDPNLHSIRYGWINYPELSQHAGMQQLPCINGYHSFGWMV